MRLTRFNYADKSLEWKLSELLLNKLTLLVGASGVGKTQILRSIMNLKKIVGGGSMNGVVWLLEFETIENQLYRWEGEYENKGNELFLDDDDYDDDIENEKEDRNKPKIIFEKLFLNNKLIIDRRNETILFNKKPTIKLSQQKSVLNLLKEEDLVKPAHDGLKMIYISDHSNSVNASRGFNFSFLNANKLTKKYNTLKKIQESDLDTPLKLFFLSRVDKKTFETIRQRFSDIFPQVDDLKVAPLESKDQDLPDFLKDYPFIQIKEKGVKKWINQNRISSGMYRTLMQLCELYLCSEGTIFLIDEFENSLGINCINEITSDILTSRRKLQFILTSHHPYIIDSISFSNWKLVTRNSGVIKTHDIDKFHIGKSKHSAFMQLLQLEEFQTGQEQLI